MITTMQTTVVQSSFMDKPYAPLRSTISSFQSEDQALFAVFDNRPDDLPQLIQLERLA